MSGPDRTPDGACVLASLNFDLSQRTARDFHFGRFVEHMGNQWAHRCPALGAEHSAPVRPQLQTCTCNWRCCHVHHKFLMVPHALPVAPMPWFLPLATCLLPGTALAMASATASAAATIEATLKMQPHCENLDFFAITTHFSEISAFTSTFACPLRDS